MRSEYLSVRVACRFAAGSFGLASVRSYGGEEPRQESIG